ncbi:MAG: recombinase family protein, partial [Pseudomonadota bacterium]
TIAGIAKETGTSTRRVQQMIELAFLAPDLVKDALTGKRPTGFTSNWFKRHGLPSSWQAQRDLVATL